MNEIIPQCRNCNAGQKKQTIRAKTVYGGRKEHRFWACSDCDLVYLYPLLTGKEEKYFYASEFEKFMENRSSDDRDWSGPEEHIKTNQDQVKRRWKFLQNYVYEGADILEIGCSSGFMLDAFKNENANCIGIEPSGGFSKFLKKKGHQNFNNLDALKDAYPNIKFDLIVHFFVLEHISDTRNFIIEQLNLLKDDGVIIIEVPCVNDPLTSLYNIPKFEQFYWSIAHHYYFSPESISNILDTIKCKYNVVPEQRYDLSNHIVWLNEGKPGGQGGYNKVFSKQLIENYKNDLKNKWICDTMFIYIYKI